MAGTSLKEKIKGVGPSALVTAAFVGPGTVTTASLAGGQSGYQLLSIVALSIFSIIVLQLVIAYLSTISGTGLTDLILDYCKRRWLKYLGITLILLAVLGGGLAYEMGNINGAALGVSTIVGGNVRLIGVFLTLAIAIILYLGTFELIKKLMILIVVLMSLSFVITTFIVKPDWLLIFKGFCNFKFSESTLPILIALLGTTVVPYNFFLYSETLIRDRIRKNIDVIRFDIFLMMIIGGIITASIVITSAYQFYFSEGNLVSGISISQQLRPLFGSFSQILFGLGFFAAGLSSSLTAPLTVFLVLKILLKSRSNGEKLARFASLTVVFFGGISLYFGLKPIQIILVAQIANGFILPFISLILVVTLIRYRKNVPAVLTGLAFLTFLLISFFGFKALFNLL